MGIAAAKGREIKSEKNVGTTFSIRVPGDRRGRKAAAKPGNRANRPHACGCWWWKTRKSCELIAAVSAQRMGHSTACALRGMSAGDFRKGTFDLVITDQAMPAMNGAQLAVAVKEHSPATPVILLTGLAMK